MDPSLKEKVKSVLGHHRVKQFKGKEGLSSNLALLLYHSVCKKEGQSVEEIQNVVIEGIKTKLKEDKNIGISGHKSG